VNGIVVKRECSLQAAPHCGSVQCFIPSVTLFLKDLFSALSFSELSHLQVIVTYITPQIENQVICSPVVGEDDL
jgi:hypothetical protein